jgi:hypothetical protein
MNTTVMATQVGPPSHAKNHLDNLAPPSRPVILPLTLEHVRTFHRSIPILVREVRRQLALRRPDEVRDVVLDLSDVAPAPAAAPLLFLVRLLRRLTDEDVRIEVSGVTPALAAALTPFDMPDRVAITDTQGRRWPY